MVEAVAVHIRGSGGQLPPGGVLHVLGEWVDAMTLNIVGCSDGGRVFVERHYDLPRLSVIPVIAC